VVEASTAPEHLDEYVAEVMRLLRAQAEAIRPVDLERARNQIAVKALRAQEQPFRQLEEAAQDLFVHGQLRSREALTERFLAVAGEQVREAFGKMLKAGATVSVAGTVRQGARERLRELVGR
jgi:predicted Zn-dependent peptidase